MNAPGILNFEDYEKRLNDIVIAYNNISSLIAAQEIRMPPHYWAHSIMHDIGKLEHASRWLP